MKNIFLPVISILYIILISAFPVQSLNGAQYGLSAFLGTVLPALLPFFAATTVLIRSGACDWIARLFKGAMRIFRLPGDAAIALVVSFLSGYPAGAKAVADLHSAGKLSERQSSVAYVLCSTTGPAFILGTIGAMIPAHCGIYIMLPHYISAIVVGIIAGIYVNPKPLAGMAGKAAKNSGRENAALIMVDAIASIANGLWKVASFMMFFSSLAFVLSGLGVLDLAGQLLGFPLKLLGLQPQLGPVLAGGMLEMASGCMSAAYTSAGYGSILPLISFIISFGGLSILMQIFVFASSANVRFGYLLGFKCIQGVVSMLLTSLLLLVLPLDIETFSMAAPLAGKVEIGILELLVLALLPLVFALVSMLRSKGYKKQRV